MPFTTEDVEKHNKGLSDKAKETWVKVANSAFKKCSEDGESDCDASAIKQANAVIAKEFAEKETAEINGVEIFATGIWHGDKYTTKDLDDMVESFDIKGFEAPVKLGHNSEQEKDGQPSFGWIGRVYREGEKLLANLTDIPKKLAEAIERKQFRQVSSEIIWNFKDGMPRVLRAVALLGADIPEVKGLAPLDKAEIAFSDEVDCRMYDMENKDDKTDKSITEEKRMSDEKTIEDLKKQLEVKNKEIEGKDTELKEFSDKAAEAVAKLDEAQAEVKTEKITAFTDTLEKEGKLLPAHKEIVTKLFTSLNDTICHTFSEDGKKVELNQLETAMKVFSELPKFVEFDEKGKGGKAKEERDESNEASVEVDRLAKEFMDNEEVKDYLDAIKKVEKEYPELYKEYIGG